MEPPQAPTEQRRESRVSDLSASDFSDVPDLKRELEKCVHRIIRDGPKRSTEGSTDLRVDLEHYREEIMDIVRKCPHEIVPVDLAEPLFTPLRAEFGGNETLYVRTLEEKLREAKKEEDGLKKKNKELTREVKELRKENDEVEKLEDTRKTLMEENGRLREEAEQARKEAKKFERRLLTVEGELIEEKERAGENRKKLDGINDMIAEKRKEFEGEKMMFEAERKELEMYRCAKDDPALRALLRGTSMVAGHWIQDTKREGEMVTEMLNSRQSIQPHDQENPKTPDQEHAKPLKAMGAIHRSPFPAVGTPGGPDAVVKNGPAGTSLEDELPENWQDEGSQVSMTRPEHWGDGPRADYNVLVVENSRLKEAVAELRKQIQDPQGQIIKGQEDGSVVTSVASPRLEEIQRLEAEIARLEEVESVDNTANENEGLNTLRECERCGQVTRRVEGATQVSPEEVTVISSDGLSEAEDRIRELEDVIISQLDFHRDVKPLLTATDNLTTDAWQARMQEFRENEGQGKERDDVLFGLWGELEGARGRLGEVIGDARERLDEDALRLGIKKPNIQATPAGELVTALDTRLINLLPLHPHPFTTLLTALLPLLTSLASSYRRLTRFAFHPTKHTLRRLRASDLLRALYLVGVVATAQIYLANMRARDLWLHANSAHASAYLHDLQGMSPFNKWVWNTDTRFMVSVVEVWFAMDKVLW